MKRHFFLSLFAIALVLILLKGMVGAIMNGNFSIKQIFVSAVGEKALTDEYGHTNILLIGVGGEGHDGENLTDTMIVASLNHEDEVVSMISLPRDLYIENEALGYGTRINSIYELLLEDEQTPAFAMNELRTEIADIFNVDIHYYAKIDFNGFVEIVDALGGITVEVSQNIYDETYPADPGSGRTYQIFSLKKGTQELDGETALKYARSRHSSSDFDRARRQQDILSAIKEKALSLGVLGSPGRIKDLYDAISSNFETDMPLDEMLSLIGFAENLEGDSVLSAVIHDDATLMGGFLYTPPREDGDPYYLVPFAGDGDFSELEQFAQLFFYHPEIYFDQTPLEVLNGTRVSSLAGLTKMYLTRYGFNVVAYGNGTSKEVVDTRIVPLWSETTPEEKQKAIQRTLDLLPSMTFGQVLESIPSEFSSTNWPTKAQIIIELGEDFGSFYEEHDELFYIGIY